MATLISIAAFLAGFTLVAGTLVSAVRMFVVPRSENVLITRIVFVVVWYGFYLRLRRRDYLQRDRIAAMYAPICLLLLPVAWLGCVMAGYTAMFWAVGVQSARAAFTLSGSSLLTLGFAPVSNLPTTLLAFSEAMIGLGLMALLLAYLPAMYAAFSKREAAVALLEVRAGSPPSAVQMILRFSRIHGLEQLNEQWPIWESWFVELEESHTSLAPLVFFRSPQPNRSWITAAGTVMDCAALFSSTLDQPRSANAELTIRAGYLALRRIADFFAIAHDGAPKPTDPISVSRAEFDQACAELAAAGIALKQDREQCWRDFSGWRVNYDRVLIALSGLTMAPPAPWSGDRARPIRSSLFHGARKVRKPSKG
ncbi:MAG TPA: hypothetical protein VGE07_08630 [Herpetosiphonaceae bacterium]